MGLIEIQRAVDRLPDEDRRKLTAWIVSRYPTLQVEQLVARAVGLVEKGEWSPIPPNSDNNPQGKVLEHALRTVKELGFAL